MDWRENGQKYSGDTVFVLQYQSLENLVLLTVSDIFPRDHLHFTCMALRSDQDQISA